MSVQTIPTQLSFTPYTATPSHQESLPISFCNRKYKLLHVVGEVVRDFFYGLYHKIIAIASWVFKKNDSFNLHNQLAEYYFVRMSCKAAAYAKFGNKVVNFSLNTSGTVKDLRTSQTNEVQELRRTYGQLFDDMVRKAQIAKAKINPNLLKQNKITSGICFGQSLDFIARIKKLSKENSTTFDTVQRVSKLYQNHGTPEAQITQILHQAKVGWQPCAAVHGLKFREQIVFPNMQGNTPSLMFREVVNSLAPGSYFLSTNPLINQRTGHAMAYHKNANGTGYLFDPNFATIKTERHETAQDLWNLVKPYRENGNCKLEIIECR